jgi:type I restriction enzyme, S subunit
MSAKNVQLMEVCEIIAGQSPPSSTYNSSGIGLPFFQGKADFGEVYPTIRYWCSSPNKIAKPDDILLSVRAPVGDTNICNQEACIGRGLAAIRTGPDIDYKFLLHYLRKHAPKLVAKSNGSTKDVREIEVPLLPLPEQKRIAAILDKAEEIKHKREESLKLSDEFLKSVFVDMFGDPVTNPKGWETKPIAEFGYVVTGNTPSRNAPHYYGDHIEWIKSDNINTPSHFLTQSTEMLSETGKKVGRVVPKGSVLVTCIAGSPSCIGNAAIADRDVTFNQQINAFVPKYEEFGTFFYLMLFANKKIIQAASTNSMKGMVSKSTFEGIEILCPPKHLINDLHNIFRKSVEFNIKLNISYNDSMSCVKSLEQSFFYGNLD